MNIEENECKQGMYVYINKAIDNLKKAMNVLECDERFNDGQSEKLNETYDKIYVQILKIKSI